MCGVFRGPQPKRPLRGSGHLTLLPSGAVVLLRLVRSARQIDADVFRSRAIPNNRNLQGDIRRVDSPLQSRA